MRCAPTRPRHHRDAPPRLALRRAAPRCVDGTPVVGALVDFGLYFFHNAQELLDRGRARTSTCRRWRATSRPGCGTRSSPSPRSDLGIPHGTVRATVLIETIPAAFEMDEILYELRDHASGLNAGRWDYLFSIIKYFRDAGPEFVLPDRGLIGMPAPFMRAYAELLVKTCHRRGAFAIGGMSAFIPSRKDKEANKRPCPCSRRCCSRCGCSRSPGCCWTAGRAGRRLPGAPAGPSRGRAPPAAPGPRQPGGRARARGRRPARNPSRSRGEPRRGGAGGQAAPPLQEAQAQAARLMPPDAAGVAV